MKGNNKIRSFFVISLTTIKGGMRDRLYQGIGLLGIFLIFSTGIFSSFSMRQPLEVSINYSLSVVQIISVVVTIFLGLNLISSEIDSKAGYVIITQPISRTLYILGKFFGFAVLIGTTILLLGVFASLGVWLTSLGIQNAPNISWQNLVISLAGSFEACVVLGAIIILFTSFATSSILPFLLGCAVYAVGQSTQSVVRYIESGMAKNQFPPALKALVKGAYYVFPNFALFDFKVQAIYGLPHPTKLFAVSVAYALVYSALSLYVATVVFEKRDLP